uniref:Uncharacterized protein n=1 Tax=Quercus lobata TaxID=97700 RepID=A0A7N2LHB3_QUELO
MSTMHPSINTSINYMGTNKVTLGSSELQANLFFISLYLVAVGQGSSVAMLIISYVQENLSWDLGFGIPCVVMVIALGVFLLGTRTYRDSIKEVKSPFVRIGQVFVSAIKNRRAKPSEIAIEEEACKTLPQHNSEQFE